MADPRLNLFNFAGTLLNKNPAIFGTPHATRCPTVIQRLGQATESANEAKDKTLGLVGNYANLAAGIAGGPVGEGLTKLAKLSNQIRISGVTDGLPTGGGSSGQQFVLNTLGMDPNKLTQAAGFNPNVANTAFGAASQVYNSVSQGKFGTKDIPAVFSAFQNGTALMSSMFSPDGNALQPTNSRFGQSCGVGNYAADLISLAPKYKFLFVVQFEFNTEFSDILANINPAFVIKSSSRPSVDFEYEDVNMYNFRTKVAKKTIYQPINMKFLDDDKNHAFQLYTTYLKLLSPIANLENEVNKQDPLDTYEQAGGGMGFGSPKKLINRAFTAPTTGEGYAASLGAFGHNSTRNILRRISIFHVYRQGRMMNVMHFYNPKITKMDLDELDMASSDGAEVGLTFSYDSLYIIPGFRVFNDENSNMYNLHSMTGELYPLGADPASKFNDGDPKDGFGLSYGQDTLFSQGTVFASENAFSVRGDNFVDNTGDTMVSSVGPTISSGGNGSVANPNIAGNANALTSSVVTASNSAVAPNSTIKTTPSVPPPVDPITGTVPSSSDNSGDIANEFATGEYDYLPHNT